MIKINDDLLIVEIPEKYEDFRINIIPEHCIYTLIFTEIGTYNEPKSEKTIELPAGNWKIALVWNTFEKEEEAKALTMLQDGFGRDGLYKDHVKNEFSRITARESLRSLLLSRSLDIGKQYLFIQNIKAPVDDMLAIPVHNDDCEFKIDPSSGNELNIYSRYPGVDVKSIKLPVGRWSVLCKLSECPEELARLIVRELPIGNRFYNYNGDYPVWWYTGLMSLTSWVKSQGHDLNRQILLLYKRPESNGSK